MWKVLSAATRLITSVVHVRYHCPAVLALDLILTLHWLTSTYNSHVTTVSIDQRTQATLCG